MTLGKVQDKTASTLILLELPGDPQIFYALVRKVKTQFTSLGGGGVEGKGRVAGMRVNAAS